MREFAMPRERRLSGAFRQGVSVCVAALFFVGLFAAPTTTKAFYGGSSFEARKQAYIDDQGGYWASRYPGATYWYGMAVWAWLERGTFPDRVGQVIEGYTTPVAPDSPECQYPWNVHAGCHDHHPSHISGLRILLQYGNRLSTQDLQKLEDYYSNGVDQNAAFANNNYAFTHTSVGYLAAKYLDPEMQVTYHSTYNYPGDFSYAGRIYEDGKQYRVLDLFGDNLLYLMDKMVFRSDEEWQSQFYSQHVVRSLALVYDFAGGGSPDAVRADLKQRAKMTLDFLFLEAGLQTSAKQWGGTIGRSYCSITYGANASFPLLAIYLGVPGSWQRDAVPHTDFYVSTYRLPAAVEDAIVLDDEPEDYWHLVTGHQQGLEADYIANTSLYTYVTKHYNLGGAYQVGGWQLNIEGEHIPFKLWMNGSLGGCEGSNAISMGSQGFQNRNVLFNYQYSMATELWVFKGDQEWDEEREEGGWRFFRKGKTAVAVRFHSPSRSGLEVALVGPGLDYASFAEFKHAVTANARIGASSITSSKGLAAAVGSIEVDPAGIPRLRAVDHRGETFVDWVDNVLKVERHDVSCHYDFAGWAISGNGCGSSAPKSTFDDVPASHWAFASVEALYRGRYIAGCATNPLRYCPEATMTRGEMAVFVERGVHGGGYLPPAPTEAVFADVPLTEWFAKWADGLWRDRYTAGCGTAPLRFCPLAQHTRAEATVYFERMMNGPDYQPSEPTVALYDDVPLGLWYTKWVDAAHRDGLLQECEEPAERADRLFRPLAGLSRAEAACMMVKAKGLSATP